MTVGLLIIYIIVARVILCGIYSAIKERNLLFVLLEGFLLIAWSFSMYLYTSPGSQLLKTINEFLAIRLW